MVGLYTRFSTKRNTYFLNYGSVLIAKFSEHENTAPDTVVLIVLSFSQETASLNAFFSKLKKKSSVHVCYC